MNITDEHRQQFKEEGFFILKAALNESELKLLRGQCQHFINKMDARMDEEGTDTLGINHRGQRYFLSNCFRESTELREFIFSDRMAEICRATIGETAFLFWEQYVVKCAEVGMKFGWHQDSGYVGYPHTPYLTCWCALDDVSEENGTVHVLPFSKAGVREMVPHEKQEGTNDKVGYFGDEPGVPVIGPAGTIAVFSSVSFHCSGPNTTDKPRRSYLAQYSPDVVMLQDNSGPWGNEEPFLKDGERLTEGAAG
jgi:ectoine hydroxylase-related dioxygenase (phytanoyl-CoA dioxygenase family)